MEENTTTAVTKNAGKDNGLVEVKVVSLDSTNRKSNIFVSIDLPSYEFKQNEWVKLPEAVVEYLEDAEMLEYYDDDDGKAATRRVPQFSVSRKRN